MEHDAVKHRIIRD